MKQVSEKISWNNYIEYKDELNKLQLELFNQTNQLDSSKVFKIAHISL